MDDLNEEIKKIAEAVEALESEKYPMDMIIGLRTLGGGFAVVSNGEADDNDYESVRESMVHGGREDVVMMIRLRAKQRSGTVVN